MNAYQYKKQKERNSDKNDVHRTTTNTECSSSHTNFAILLLHQNE